MRCGSSSSSSRFKIRPKQVNASTCDFDRCCLQSGDNTGNALTRFEESYMSTKATARMSDQSSNRPLTSKAVTYKALGGPEVIEYVERTVRAPAAGEVRIEVKAAAVNPFDLMFRDPGWPNMTSNIVPGMDAAGVIESGGPSGSRLHPGQEVIAE